MQDHQARLPHELIVRITELISNAQGLMDPSTARQRNAALCRMSLVCHAWKSIAQRELYRTVCLLTGPTATSFLNCRSTSHSTPVKRLVMMPAQTLRQAQLDVAPSARTVRLTSQDATSIRDLDLGPILQPEHVAAAVSACASTLTTLEISQIDIIPSSIFEHLVHLTDLVLNECSFHLPYPTLPFRLKRLFIANHSIIVLRHQLCALEASLASLEHIALHYYLECAEPWYSKPRRRELVAASTQVSFETIYANPQLLIRMERVLRPVVRGSLQTAQYDASFEIMFDGLFREASLPLPSSEGDALFTWTRLNTTTRAVA